MFDIIQYSVNKYGYLWKTYNLLETVSNFVLDPGLVCGFTNLSGLSHKNYVAVCRISSKFSGATGWEKLVFTSLGYLAVFSHCLYGSSGFKGRKQEKHITNWPAVAVLTV